MAAIGIACQFKGPQKASSRLVSQFQRCDFSITGAASSQSIACNETLSNHYELTGYYFVKCSYKQREIIDFGGLLFRTCSFLIFCSP